MLASWPMRGCDRLLRFRQHQMQPLGVIARGLYADVRRLHHAAAAALGAALHIGPEIVERQVPLVIRPVEPFRRHTSVPLAPAYIHFPATSPRRLNRIQNFHNTHRHSSVTGAGSHSPSPQPVAKAASLSFTLQKRHERQQCGTKRALAAPAPSPNFLPRFGCASAVCVHI